MREFNWEQMTYSMSYSQNGISFDRFRGPDGREADVVDKGQSMREAQMEAYQLWVVGAK